MIRRAAPLLLLAACVATESAPPAHPAGTVTYACDGGQRLVVAYGTENGQDKIDINIDGPEMLLREEGFAGLRYSWPSDGSYHIWQVAGAQGPGTLSYRDGEKGTTSPVLTNCRA